MTYFDRELEAMDRAAADRLERENFARRHPEWSQVNDWAASIVMSPLATLIRAAVKADARRFDGAPLTGFDSLGQSDQEEAALIEKDDRWRYASEEEREQE